MPLAFIHWLTGENVPPIIVVPPGTWGGAGEPFPTHPIVIPLPPHIWGGGNEPFPTPPICIPPDAVSPGVPAHPIYLPPEIWGGANEPMPTPPIANAPGVPPSGKPPGTWGGSGEPFPTPPIHIPPEPASPAEHLFKVLVIPPGPDPEPVWFLVDPAGVVRPPPTQPEPKKAGRK